MLKALRIKDFAIIDELDIEFEQGFTVFTGETGAGKSILVDAIGIVTGGRAAADSVREGSDEAIVEAIFEREDHDEVLIRRNISRNGKSRIYVNNLLSTLSLLDEIGKSLVDIHGQHDHQNLLKKETHIEYLDALGRLSDHKKRVRERYHYLQHLKKRLIEIEESCREKKDKEDLMAFQLTELKGAGLRSNEDKDLASERNILSHSKRISSLSDSAYSMLYESENSILSELFKLEVCLEEIAAIDSGMGEAASMVKSSRVNLREATEQIRRFRDNVVYDPGRLEKIEERLYEIERLKKKYNQSLEEILNYQSEIEKDLVEREHSDKETDLLKENIQLVLRELEKDAAGLSESRENASMELERKVGEELTLLQMENTAFVVGMEKGPLSENGFDRVEFMIANVNEVPRPLARVASGGELSRIMLAIKSCLSSVDSVGTMVFDEVDAGIGGRVAEEVGRRLKSLSRDHQVCSVTHLPQIAAMADSHYRVDKVLVHKRVTTRIRKLSEQERIMEISRMLGAKDKTRTALKYAEEMVKLGSKQERV